MNDTANVTLHIGALPVMAHALEEVQEMVTLAGALVLNIGTLSKSWVQAMHAAADKANDLEIPIILDPVGAGATAYRTDTALSLLEKHKITILRGNPGEIGVLSGVGGTVRGVESIGKTDVEKAANKLALSYQTTVVVTGRHDLITDGKRVLSVKNGHEWLTTITGSGCMCTAVTAAFAAVETDPVIAAGGALAAYGLAAELAAREARGPASFKVAMLDMVYRMTPKQLTEEARAQFIT